MEIIESIEFGRANSEAELIQVLKIQQANSKNKLSKAANQSEGFVTVMHDLQILKEMNDACPHILAKDGNKVVGYALTMLPSFRLRIPILGSLFDLMDRILPDQNYLVMGQVCIDKHYRGKGLLKKMYAYYRQELSKNFDCLVTEVAIENQRSLQAHKKVGFETVYTREENGVFWDLLIWNWLEEPQDQ